MRWGLRAIWAVVLFGCANGAPASVTGDASLVTPPGHPDGGPPDAPDTPDASPRAPDAGGGADAGATSATDLDRLRGLVDALRAAPDDATRRTLTQAFLAQVAYGGGFPIRVRDQVGFAFLDDGTGGALTVAGDFNGWNGTALPLSQPVAGFPFYYRIETVTPPAGRSLYKLVRNGSSWFADPAARSFGWDSNGQYSLLEPGRDRSHLERWPAFAASVGRLQPRELIIYVPAGASATRLPVLYMHDGQNLFDPAGPWGGWHAGDAADAFIAGGGRAFYLVGVPNTSDRFDEYTQTKDVVSGHQVGGRADEYVAFLVDGVKPFVDARYPTLSGAADTGVCGSSLGGVISIYAAWTRPDVFGHAASLSGTMGWGSMASGLHNPTIMELYRRTTPPRTLGIYLDSGGGPGSTGCLDSDGDGVHDDGNSGDNYCETLDLMTALHDLGWTDGSDLTYVWSQNGTHDELHWAQRFPGLLSSWFPGR